MTQTQIVVNNTHNRIYRVSVSGDQQDEETINRIVKHELERVSAMITENELPTNFSLHCNELDLSLHRLSGSELLSQSIYNCFLHALENSMEHREKKQIQLAAFLSMIRAWRNVPVSDQKCMNSEKWLKQKANEMILFLEKESSHHIAWEGQGAEYLIRYMRDFIQDLDRSEQTDEYPIQEEKESPECWIKSDSTISESCRCELVSLGAPGVALGKFITYKMSLERNQKAHQYDDLDFGLQDLIREIPEFHAQFWNFIKAKHVNRWISVLNQLALMVVECHYGLGHIAPSPRHICMMLKIFSVMDLLYRISDVRFERFHFDMEPVEKILQDPYLNLESLLIPIQLCIRHLHQPSTKAKKPVRFTSVSIHDLEDSSSPYYQDQELLTLFCSGHKEKGYQDFGQLGILPKGFIALREVYIALQMMIGPTRTLFVKELAGKNTDRSDLQTMNLEVDHKTEPEELPYQISHQAVISRIHSHHDPIRFHITEDPSIMVKPWNLTFQDIEDPLTSQDGTTSRFSSRHPSIYEETGVTINDRDFIDYLFNRRVAIVNDGCVDNEGIPVPRTALTVYQRVGAQGRTQKSILEEHVVINGLPEDVSIEMQSINVGYRTVVKETIAKVAKHYHLLYNSDHAPVWHRLIKRNIFGSSSLLYMLTNEPDNLCLMLKILHKTLIQAWEQGPMKEFLYIYDLCDSMLLFIRQCFDEHLVPAGKFTWQADPQVEEAAIILNHWLKRFLPEMEEAADEAFIESTFTEECHQQLLMQIVLRYERLHQLAIYAHPKPPPVTNHELQKILINFFRLNSNPYPLSASRLDTEMIKYFLYRLTPRIDKWLSNEKESNAFCNEVLGKLNLENSGRNRKWRKTASRPIFTSNPYLINFCKCEVWKDRQRVPSLPNQVVKQPHLRTLRNIVSKSTPTCGFKHMTFHLKKMEPQVLADVLCNGAPVPAEWAKVLHQLKNELPFYSQNIFFTENFNPFIQDDNDSIGLWNLLDKGEKHPRNMNRISRVLVVIDTNTQDVGICIPSLKDLDCEVEEYISLYKKQAKEHGILLSIYNLDTSCIDSGCRWEDLSQTLQSRIMYQVIQVKFLNGDTHFFDPQNPRLEAASNIPVDCPHITLMNEIAPLTRWLDHYSGDISILEFSVHKFIRQYRQSQQFGGSSLERAFENVKRGILQKQ